MIGELMFFAGIDPSLTGTGASILNTAGDLVAVTTFKSKKGQYASSLHRYLTLAYGVVSYICDYVDPGDVIISIEGYSFGSRGAAVFSLAEFGGILRFMVAEKFGSYYEVPPTVLKKFATGKGNANKNVVLEQVFRKFGMGSEVLTDDNQVDGYCLSQFSKEIYFDHDTTFAQKYKYTRTEWVNYIN